MANRAPGAVPSYYASTVAADSAIHRERFDAVLVALLEAGADVNAAPTESKCTPLILASRIGLVEAVPLLLEYGADVNVTDQMVRRDAVAVARSCRQPRYKVCCRTVSPFLFCC